MRYELEGVFQRLVRDIPDYQVFFTLEEMDQRSRQLARDHPECVSLFEMGRTRENRPIFCLKIGEGSRNALMFGCPHPNEPIGTMLLDYFSQRLAEDLELREKLDYTWYLVKAWDADGLVRNEGWIKGPYNIYNYGRHFFRPASYAQVDWTFPIDYDKYHFHSVLPETQAMMNLIDQIQPEFIYALHNSGFGGTYWYESEATPEIYQKLHAIPEKYGLPMSLGAAESPANVAFAPAIYRCNSFRDEYDYLKRYAPGKEKNLRAGECSAAYAYERYHSFTLLTELPYFYDPRISDTSPGELTRLEVRRRSVEEMDAIDQDLRSILALSRPWLSEDNPYYMAVDDFCRNTGGGQASLNQAEKNPAFQELATQAEQLDQLVIGKFYKMILYGMLARANEEELVQEAGSNSCRARDLRQGRDAALEGLKRITDFLEAHLNYSVVPIRTMIGIQLESGLVILEHLRRLQTGGV